MNETFKNVHVHISPFHFTWKRETSSLFPVKGHPCRNGQERTGQRDTENAEARFFLEPQLLCRDNRRSNTGDGKKICRISMAGKAVGKLIRVHCCLYPLPSLKWKFCSFYSQEQSFGRGLTQFLIRKSIIRTHTP